MADIQIAASSGKFDNTASSSIDGLDLLSLIVPSRRTLATAALASGPASRRQRITSYTV